MSSVLRIDVAPVFEPLLSPARYKGAYGGRGSGKSHFFAESAVARACKPGTRIVCIREVQKSLKESAKRLIEDKLEKHGLGEGQGFRVLKDSIETPGNGVIMFQGMQDHNAESIKSLESVDVAWVEEAHTLSEHSLRLLRPTIRAEGSELWFSWNPRRRNDPVDLLLRHNTPTDSVVVKANWDDNPWLPEVLRQEREDCLANNADEYDHIWEGGYAVITKGAYFARHLTDARREGRIGKVAADPLMKYRLFVDIGGTGAKSDAFAIWVAQFVGTEIRVLDYYEAQGQDLAAHLAWMRSRGYQPEHAGIWLPHDGATNDKVFAVSYESALRQAGYEVTVVPNQGRGAASKRIDEARRLFPSMHFNEETCRGGLEALGWYHERIDEVRQIGLGPEHDWSSHAADAFGLMAVAHQTPAQAPQAIKFTGWGS